MSSIRDRAIGPLFALGAFLEAIGGLFGRQGPQKALVAHLEALRLLLDEAASIQEQAQRLVAEEAAVSREQRELTSDAVRMKLSIAALEAEVRNLKEVLAKQTEALSRAQTQAMVAGRQADQLRRSLDAAMKALRSRP